MDLVKQLCFYIPRIFLAIILVILSTLKNIILLFVPQKYLFKDISKETVLITGGGNGIGRELARKFSKLAAKLILLDIRIDDLRSTSKILKEEGASSDVYIFKCDVSKREEIYELAGKILKEIGPVTMLINNAGIVSGAKLLDLADEAIVKTMEVNALAHFWTCKAFLPNMMATNYGHVVSIASLAGFSGVPKLTDYCASKFAAVGFMEALKEELLMEGLTGIKLTTVAPYLVNTQLFVGFQMFLKGTSPEDAADVIVSGILRNKDVLSVPEFFMCIAFIPACFPSKFLTEMKRVTGVLDSMQNFKGKAKST